MNLTAINSNGSLWPVTRSDVQGTQQPAEQPDPASQGQSAVAPVQESAEASVQAQSQQLTGEEWADSVTGQARAMASASAATPTAISTNTNLPELYKFSNQYLYSGAGNTWAKIDTDVNGNWSKDELTAYANAYYKATGVTLDVDDLMDTYDTGNKGYLDYFDQNRMYADDALGISYVKDEILRAEMGVNNGGGAGSSGGSGKVNYSALDDFVNKYTYGYPGKMYANVDQNQDGVWTKDELMAYAKAYNKATGGNMDGEALFAKYDQGGKGYLDYFDINNMYKDNALGLSEVKDLLAGRPDEGSGSGSGSGNVGNGKNNDRLYNTLMDMWGSKFSSGELRSLATAFTQGMQKAAMLDAFSFANRYISMGPWGGGYGYGYGSGTYTNWMAGSLNMLNMFV